MTPGNPVREALFLCLKFLLLVPVLTALWWWFLPYYGWLLVQICGGVLRFALGVPVEAGRLVADGILNTASLMAFVIDGAEVKAKITVIVTNVPVYAALIGATSGLVLKRRLAILAGGTAILVAGHVAFIVFAIRFGKQLSESAQIPTAVAQLFVTLPFLLWIILAYWDRLGGLFQDDRNEPGAGG